MSTQDYVSCFSLHFFRALAASCVLYVLFHALQKYLKYNKHSSLHLARHMILYLNLDIICSSKLTVFLDHLSRTTFRFSEQTMSADNNEGYCSFIAVTNPCRNRTNVLLPLYSLRSRRNFGERVLNNFITKIMAAIFDNNGSGKLRREINLYQGGGRRSKIRRGVGVGE